MSSDNDNSDEERIQEIMKEKGCSRESAEGRLRSVHVAVAALNPSPKSIGIDPFAPISPTEYLEKIRQRKAQQIHDVEVREETESEESEAIEDPFLEQKQSQFEQKQRILDEIENQLDREQAEDEVFKAILAVPQWRELLIDYVKSVQMLTDGYANYYLYTCQRIGDKINGSYEFYKNNKLVTVDTTFSTSEGTKTVAEIIAQQEAKKEEYMKKIKHSGIATVESNQKEGVD